MSLRRLFVALCLLTLAPVSPAAAHAVLMGTNPEADLALKQSPAQIRLTFNESVGPIFLRVLNAQGKEVGKPGAVVAENHDIYIDLGETLPDDIYIVTYRVVSADTHPVGGSYVFTVGEAVAGATPSFDAAAATQSSNVWTLPVAVNRTVQFAALLIAAGLGLFGLLIRVPADLQTTLSRSGSIVSFIAAATFILAVGLGGAEMMGEGARLFHSDSWGTGLNTTLGPSLGIGLVGLIILMAGFMMGFAGWGRHVLWLGILVSLSSLLVTGHAATASPKWFMTPVVGLHLLCVAFWFGALWPLLVALKRYDRQTSVNMVREFTSWALASVALIVLTGIGISLIQLESVNALIDTDYGIKLVIKLGLVLGLLCLAGMNRNYFTPALEKGSERAASRLGGSITGEVALFVGILALTTTLSQATPPRALAEQTRAGTRVATDGFETTIESEGYALQVMISPAKPGTNNVMAHVLDNDGNMFDAVSLTTQWAFPAAGLEPLKIDLEPSMPGMYEAEIGQIIISGTWELRVDVLVDDYTKVIFRTEVPIR